MEIVVKTEYQDIYRVKDGVLLIVNKFEYLFNNSYFYDRSKRRKTYNKNTKSLYINQEDADDYNNNFIPKGTVLYINRPVISTDDKSKWRYEIKTTGDCFSGSYDDVIGMLDDIINVMGLEE